MWGHAFRGLFVGAGLGLLAGLWFWGWLIDGLLLFPGDLLLFGAVAGWIAGFLFGELFLDWVGDHWRWFT